MPGARLAFVYDHLYPHTVGGAERYYAALCAELAREQPVVYLTRAFGDARAAPHGGGVEIVALTCAPAGGEPRGFLRRNAAKLRFCLALAIHLLRHGGRYDVVHCCSFPQIAVLAAAIGLAPHRRTRLVGDWHEVLSRRDWRDRLGLVGEVGRGVQRLAARAGDAAVTFSRLHERRLAAEGRQGPVTVVPEFPPEGHVPESAGAQGREPLIVFAGRLVRQKRAHLVPRVLAELRGRDPAWRAEVYGAGPEAVRVARAAAEAEVEGAVRLCGFAPWEELAAAMLRARALVLPTVREGFGLVVLEAAAHGLPSVLVADEDNAAVELIAPGENGVVCERPDPALLAEAVLALAVDPNAPARARAWFDRHRGRYSVESAAAELRGLHARLR